jgi:hypothetical protein
MSMYPVLMATLRSADPAPDRTPAPWEANLRATCECLSWRGALDNLERRHAEDTLGETTHRLLERGEISEHELEAKMKEVRARFEQA